MLTNIVLSVGVSDFLYDYQVPSLKYSATDATWFARLSNACGVSKKNIYRLANKSATKRNILDTIDGLSGETSSFRLFLFISSHGTHWRPRCGGGELIIYCYDTSMSNKLASSLSINELALKISTLENLSELYLFIDACQMSIEIIESYFNRHFDYSVKINVLIANNNGYSYEGVANEMGEFSSSLLRALCDPRVPADILAIKRHLQLDIRGIDKGNVQIYKNSADSSFPLIFNSQKPTSGYVEINEVDIVNILTKLMNNKVSKVSLVGGQGTGKTQILKKVSRLLDVPIVTFPYSKTKLTYTEVIDEIASSVFKFIESNFKKTFDFLNNDSVFIEYASIELEPMIVIDGGEHIESDFWLKLLSDLNLSQYKILTSDYTYRLKSLDFSVMKISNLSYVNSKKVAHSHSVFDIDIINQAFYSCDGVIQRFLENLSDSSISDLPEELMNALSYVYSSGGFLNKGSYCNITGIPEVNINSLIDLGIITSASSLYRVHDLVSETLEISDKNIHTGVLYWKNEIETSDSLQVKVLASEKFLERSLLLKKSEVIRSEFFTSSFITVKNYQSASRLVKYALISFEYENYDIFSTAVRLLSSRGKIDELNIVVSDLSTLTSELSIEVNLCLARCYWWQGEYDKCIDTANNIIFSQSVKQEHLNKAKLELAIGHFFLGDWELVIVELEKLINQFDIDPKDNGWCMLILGTTLAIRGVKTQRGLFLLKQSISLLSNTDDKAGLAIAYGNLGEVCWKLNNLSEAYDYLHQGLTLASSLQMNINEAEARRNLIHVLLKEEEQNTKELEEHLQFLIEGYDELDSMEAMQVSNTLCTYFLYNDDVDSAREWLNKSISLTDQNNEYRIYSLANEAILSAMLNNIKDFFDRLEKAMSLCLSGDNRLAAVQISNDIQYCVTKYNSNAVREILGKMKPIMEDVEYE